MSCPSQADGLTRSLCQEIRAVATVIALVLWSENK